MTRRSLPAICGLLAGPALVLSAVVAAFVQPDEFSLVEHASSDLGADTAERAWIENQLGSNVPGLLLVVFFVGLWRSLGRSRSGRIGSLLVAALGVGAFLTGFFTLDCREIDAGCTNSSWQADAHVAVAVPALLALLLAQFVLARALRLAPQSRDMRPPTIALGVVTVVGFFAGSAIGEGLGQYLAFLPWFAWIALLSVRMLRLSGEGVPVSEPILETRAAAQHNL